MKNVKALKDTRAIDLAPKEMGKTAMSFLPPQIEYDVIDRAVGTRSLSSWLLLCVWNAAEAGVAQPAIAVTWPSVLVPLAPPEAVKAELKLQYQMPRFVKALQDRAVAKARLKSATEWLRKVLLAAANAEPRPGQSLEVTQSLVAGQAAAELRAMGERF